jgi:hypothetical protein
MMGWGTHAEFMGDISNQCRILAREFELKIPLGRVILM